MNLERCASSDMTAPLKPPAVSELPDARRMELLAIYAQLTSNGIAYHGFVINLNVMLVTSNVFLTGILLTVVSSTGIATRALLAAIPLVIAGIGILVTRILRWQYFVIASVIRNVDESLGVFEEGRYIPGKSLYPLTWRNFGQKPWREIIFDIFIPLQILMSLIASALVMVR